MEPDLREIHRLVKENNQMLHSLKRQAFWGGVFKIALYLVALGVPILLYYVYLSPIVQQFQDTISTATGQGRDYQGQFAEWMQLLDQFKERMQSASGSSQ